MSVAPPLTYPLTAVQSKLIISIHEEDNAKINRELDAIRALCAEKCHSNTKKCVDHSKEVRRCWRAYYASPRPGSWASYRSPDYISEIRKLFDSNVDIHKIHARASKEKRLHYKDALCTVRFNDDPAVKEYKQEAAVMFDSGVPETQIREFLQVKEAQVAGQRTLKQAEYDSRLLACLTEDEKLVIYQEDACSPLESDSPALTKLRLKWKTLFDAGMPYPEIYVSMQKDICDHLRAERDLKEKLAELQRGKVAHDKEEIAKEAKKAAKETAAKVRMFSNYTFKCTNEGCQNLAVPSSQEEGIWECGICWRMVQNGMLKNRSYFCSEECMERDGHSHILKAHNCASAAACTTGVLNRSIHERYCGICVDCWKFFGVQSYFCTGECWKRNWVDHCNHRHVDLRQKLIEKLDNSKEAFEEWGKAMNLSDEEIRRAMTSYSRVSGQ